MLDKIKRAFECGKQDYINLFKELYPGHINNGFTERNQTFFFSHNYLRNNEIAACWQEMHFGKNQHIDALIKDEDSIIYLEAKRIPGENRLNSIARDMHRLINTESGAKNRKEIYAGNSKKEYILYLVDIWEETSFKIEAIKHWEENFLINKLNKIWNDPEMKLSKIEENTITNISNQIIRFDDFKFENKGVENAIRKYAIAYSLFEIAK